MKRLIFIIVMCLSFAAIEAQNTQNAPAPEKTFADLKNEGNAAINLKDYQKANYHSQKYISLYKNTYNKKLEQDIYQKEVDQRIFLQEKENELEKIKYTVALEKEQQNKNYFLLVLIALLIIFIVVTRAYWINKKYSKKLKDTNNTLSQTQVEVLEQNHILYEQSAELITQSEELKSSHEELIAMNDNLESIVNQRSQEIIEKNKMLEEYAFINAHKLRAPVARLLGLMQIIQLSKDTNEIELYVRLCDKEIKDLDRIVWTIKEAIEEKTPHNRCIGFSRLSFAESSS